MSKPKILFLITQGRWGGAQKYVYDLATALAADFEITVAVGDPEGERQLQEKFSIQHSAFSITVIQLKHLRRPISLLHDLLAIWEIRKLYKKIKPGIIHLNSSKAGIIGSCAKWVMFHVSYVMIYTAHGWVFEEPLPAWLKHLYRLAEKWTARMKDMVVVLSERDKKTAMDSLKIPAKKLFIIPPGTEHPVHILSLGDGRNRLRPYLPPILSGLSNEGLQKTFLTGSIANHYETKGLDVLIDAFAQIHQQMPDAHLAIIGDGPQRPQLEGQIKDHRLDDHVHLLGFIAGADKQQLVAGFNVFVLPSRKEGLPYTILEAKMNRVPIVATAVGAVPTLIEDHLTGLLVPPDDLPALAATLRWAYEHPAEMKTMAETGHRDYAQKYTEAAMIAATTTLYRSLLPRAEGFH